MRDDSDDIVGRKSHKQGRSEVHDRINRLTEPLFYKVKRGNAEHSASTSGP